uniref:helix-turn-helix domain-containing protein n=1 Tax=Alteromonas gracilis TaxID=1479524 RepID=UPI0036F206C6
MTEGQRYQIEDYLREGFSYREIGKRLKESHNAINLEVRRNKTRGSHYLSEVTQARALKRKRSFLLSTLLRRQIKSTIIKVFPIVSEPRQIAAFCQND